MKASSTGRILIVWFDCTRLLAEGRYGDAPLVAGESAVAGLAGLIAAAADAPARARLGLDANSHIVLFGTEGATDPETYAAIVGRKPEAVETAPTNR